MGHLGRRYWGMGRTASEAAEVQERAAVDFIESLGAPDQIKQAGFINKAYGHDRMPSMDSGLPTQKHIKDDMVSPGRIGGDGILIEGTHMNANGDRIVTAYRKNGPHMEKVHIREERVGQRTRIISEVYGGHS